MAGELAQAAALIASTQVHLELEGYPRRLAEVGLRRARGIAEEKARPISSAIYEQAFLDLLIDEIKGVRAWMDAQRRVLAEAS